MSADASLALLRALAAGGPPFEVEEVASRRWASATFTGARHTLRLSAADDAATERWLDDLPEAEFRLAGHVMIEVAVTALLRAAGRAHATIDALTLEAG